MSHPPDRFVILNGWLCLVTERCTCDPVDGAHQSGCGAEPLIRVTAAALLDALSGLCAGSTVVRTHRVTWTDPQTGRQYVWSVEDGDPTQGVEYLRSAGAEDVRHVRQSTWTIACPDEVLVSAPAAAPC